MSQDLERTRATRDRIDRLQRRLDTVKPEMGNPVGSQLRDILRGVLDLLRDEL